MPVWLWPNVLCLDAPIVATIWQDFLSRCFALSLRPSGRWTLALTVWAIYLGDRLLDVRLPAASAESGPHRFCRENRRMVTMLLAAVVAADLLLCLLWLRRPVLWNGLAVFAGVGAYFGAFPVRRIEGAWKPLAAAGLFTVGVFLVAWTWVGQARPMLVGPAVVFAALCLANLFLIQAWEQGRGERAQAWGVGTFVFAAVCAGRALAGGLVAASLWYAAVAVGAFGLAALAFAGERLGRDARRVLADAVLLSPLLLWTLAR